MSEKTILVWFRNDLRIRDNEILVEAVNKASNIVPVYCFDPRYFTKSITGHRKTGAFRLRFLLESIDCLRQSLRERGGELVIRIGLPEDILPDLCEQYNATEVYHHREVAPMETEISANVESVLWKQKINLKHFIGHTLYHKEDLPFPIKNIPNQFHAFRKKLDKDSHVRKCFAVPETIAVPAGLVAGELPDFKTLGFSGEEKRRAYSSNEFQGGEISALNWVHTLLDEGDIIDKSQLQIFTSKLSPWLSFGCISSREAFSIATAFRKLAPGISSVVITELLWRDYFRFMLKKHGEIIDVEVAEHDVVLSRDYRFKKWKNGKTGNVWVDACMTQLKNTGYLSETCRLFAGDYLVNRLGIEWTKGAAYYEEMLVDYAPASNAGVWAIITGGTLMNQAKVSLPTAEVVARHEDLRRWISPDTSAQHPQPV